MSRSSAAASLRLSSGDGRARIRQMYRQLASGAPAVDWRVAQAAGLARRDGDRVAWQDAAELTARADIELGEDLTQVILDRTRADEVAGADLRVRQPVPG